LKKSYLFSANSFGLYDFWLAQRAWLGNANAFAYHLHPSHGHLGIVPIQPVAAAPVPDTAGFAT
jgi:hypothetical protein